MPITKLVRPLGSWCDVVPWRDGFALIYIEGSTVVAVDEAGEPVWRVSAPEPLLFLRAAASTTGVIAAIGKGAITDTAYVVTVTGAIPAGATFGNQPVIIWFDGSRVQVAIQRAPMTYSIGPLGALELRDMPVTSQGFIDVIVDRLIRWDDQFIRDVNGHRLATWVERPPFVVGQWADRNGAAVVFTDRPLALTLIRSMAYEPHVAVQGDRIAVCARTPTGAQLAILTPPYAEEQSSPTPQAPTPPPPKETPVSVPNLETDLHALQAATGLVNKGASEEERKNNAGRFIEIFVWENRHRGIGHQLKGGNNFAGHSVDGFLFKTDRGLLFVDVINNAEGHAGPARIQWSEGWDHVGAPHLKWGDPFPAARQAPVPTPPDATPAPSPTPQPAPAPAPTGELLAAVKDAAAAAREDDPIQRDILARLDQLIVLQQDANANAKESQDAMRSAAEELQRTLAAGVKVRVRF